MLLSVQTTAGIDDAMLSHDKLFVVMAVVMIIWFGLIFLLYRNDRKLDRLENILNEKASKESDVRVEETGMAPTPATEGPSSSSTEYSPSS